MCDQDKTTIKQHIVDLMCSVPDQIQKLVRGRRRCRVWWRARWRRWWQQGIWGSVVVSIVVGIIVGALWRVSS